MKTSGGGIVITADVSSGDGNITVGGGASPASTAAIGTAATNNDGGPHRWGHTVR